MDKLNKIIAQLNIDSFTEIEKDLVKNKSDNFLLLFRSYRYNTIVKDAKLRSQLNCNENSFYVLKSRLYDKIQKHLLQKNEPELKYSVNLEVPIAQYLYDYPRETALAILHKLEEQYTINDVPGELAQLYSVLKKIYYHSDKYYYYSQLYNRQVAYAISIEKAEDVFCNFNKTLSNYWFSRSENDKEIILVLLQEIENINTLCQSHRVELIKNFILTQILLFTDIVLPTEESEEDLLDKCDKIIKQYINDKKIVHFEQIISYLKFEYYTKIGQLKKSMALFNDVNKHSQTWLLQNNNCMAFKFLFTKASILIKLDRKNEMENDANEMLFDSNDFYTIISLNLFKAVAKFYNKKTEESIAILSPLVQELTLKDFLHMELELKLTLAFFYFKNEAYTSADEILKGIYRKVNKSSYQNAKIFIQLLNMLMSIERKSNSLKIARSIKDFHLFNSGRNKILDFLQSEIDEVKLNN